MLIMAKSRSYVHLSAGQICFYIVLFIGLIFAVSLSVVMTNQVEPRAHACQDKLLNYTIDTIINNVANISVENACIANQEIVFEIIYIGKNISYVLTAILIFWLFYETGRMLKIPKCICDRVSPKPSMRDVIFCCLFYTTSFVLSICFLVVMSIFSLNYYSSCDSDFSGCIQTAMGLSSILFVCILLSLIYFGFYSNFKTVTLRNKWRNPSSSLHAEYKIPSPNANKSFSIEDYAQLTSEELGTVTTVRPQPDIDDDDTVDVL